MDRTSRSLSSALSRAGRTLSSRSSSFVDRYPSTPSSPTTSSQSASSSVCDKCDSKKHGTSACPHFRKKRENHPDALKRTSKGIGSTSKPLLIRNARVIKQPGDGSCLFHSLSYGLQDRSSASSLRRELMSWINNNSSLEISDSPLQDWVKWDSNSSVSAYTRRMSMGGWGGGIEMAACCNLKGVTIEVFEKTYTGYKRISAFVPNSGGSWKTVRVLYQGGVHYDALSD